MCYGRWNTDPRSKHHTGSCGYSSFVITPGFKTVTRRDLGTWSLRLRICGVFFVCCFYKIVYFQMVKVRNRDSNRNLRFSCSSNWTNVKLGSLGHAWSDQILKFLAIQNGGCKLPNKARAARVYFCHVFNDFFHFWVLSVGNRLEFEYSTPVWSIQPLNYRQSGAKSVEVCR